MMCNLFQLTTDLGTNMLWDCMDNLIPTGIYIYPSTAAKILEEQEHFMTQNEICIIEIV